MMLFNMDCVNFMFKKGVRAIGAGIHKKTKKAYVYFDKEDAKFQEVLAEWNKRCEARREKLGLEKKVYSIA